MKLVLLPGMDGTGRLFEQLLQSYSGEAQVIALPERGDQSHVVMAEYICKKLLDEDVILLAESYSGSIVPHLLNMSGCRIKAVVFVASFLSPPHKSLLALAQYAPIHWLSGLPFASLAHRALFLGWSVAASTLSEFVSVLRSVPEPILKQRLKELQNIELPCVEFEIPVAYVQATQDKLVLPHKAQEMAVVFKKISYYKIKAPHFVLQVKPQESAQLIGTAIKAMQIP